MQRRRRTNGSGWAPACSRWLPARILLSLLATTATLAGADGHAAAAPVSALPLSATPNPSALTVVVELVAVDARGNPVLDLTVEQLDVVQEATKQPVKTITPHSSAPGRYELRYVPLSGKAAGVTISTTRKGVRLRGPNGPALEPRVLLPLPALDAKLLEVLAARPEASDLDCTVAVLRFQPKSEGVVHVFAADVPLIQLFGPDHSGQRRLEILALVRSSDGSVNRRLTMEREIDLRSGFRLVWTSTLPLPPGRYTADFAIREPGNERVSVRQVAFDAPPPAPRLQMSSLVFLDPSLLMTHSEGGDDPFFHGGRPVMPALRAVLPFQVQAYASFFALVFPEPGNPEPPSLSLEVLRGATRIGEVPVPLPEPEPGGEYRVVAAVPTQTFVAQPYVLRLKARQGEASVSAEALLTISDGRTAPAGPTLRLAPAAAPGGP